MKFYIFNVGHGACAALLHPNGNVALFDAGSGGPQSFTPRNWLSALAKDNLEYLFIHNFDEDHISGIVDLPRPKVLVRNKSVDATELIQLKRENDPLAPTSALQHAINLHTNYTGTLDAENQFENVFPGVTKRTYYNQWSKELGTNDCSLVAFLNFNGYSICLPGDIETRGWSLLTEKDGFLEDLENTNVLVASHHGRTNGYNRDVFHACKFHLVIFSDSAVKHGTQEETDTYGRHVPMGVKYSDGSTRRVYTTRNDGHIAVSRNDHGQWSINNHHDIQYL